MLTFKKEEERIYESIFLFLYKKTQKHKSETNKIWLLWE